MTLNWINYWVFISNNITAFTWLTTDTGVNYETGSGKRELVGLQVKEKWSASLSSDEL